MLSGNRTHRTKTILSGILVILSIVLIVARASKVIEGEELISVTDNVHNRKRDLRTIFCRCVADFETFYNDDGRRLKSYYHYDGALPKVTSKEERQSLRSKTSRYYRGEDYVDRSSRQSSTSEAVLGPDGYYIVDGITVLPLDNDACIVSQTNAALRTYLELIFRPRDQSGGRSGIRSFSSLFQNRKRRSLLLEKSENNGKDTHQDDEGERGLQGWGERRKSNPNQGGRDRDRDKTVKSILETDLRESVPDDVKPRPQPSPSGFPRVFPCPNVQEDVAPTRSPVDGIETDEPTMNTIQPTISAQPTVSASPTTTVFPTVSPEPTVSPVPTVAPTSRIEITSMPSGFPTALPSGSPTVRPTLTLPPSVSPSISAMPTISHMPTNVETLDPTISTAPTVSAMPSIDPTTSISPSTETQSPNISESPSVSPSRAASAAPTVSIFPTSSAAPTISPAPNGQVSLAPSVTPVVSPSAAPTGSAAPSSSELPSLVPSFSEAPSAVPAPAPTTSPTITALPTAPPVLNITDALARYRPKNNLCESAVSLSMDGSSMAGTTVLGTNEIDFGCNLAGGIQTSISPGVWFSAVGNGNIYEISTCSERTNFGTAIQVLMGDCDNLTCLRDGGRLFDRQCSTSDGKEWSRFGTRVRIETVVDESYLFLVLSRLGENVGVFDIYLDEIVTPPNDRCDGAITVEVDVPKVHIGTTVNATIGTNYNCALSGNGFDNTAPGIWYVTVGNGAIYTASTCTAWTNFNTAIQVFNGGGTCDSLLCLAGSEPDLDCEFTGASRVSFPTVVGEIYYIYVFGQGTVDTGTFILTMTSDSNLE